MALMVPLIEKVPHVMTVPGVDLGAVEDRLLRAMGMVGEGGGSGVRVRLRAALDRATSLPVPRGVVATWRLQRVDGVIVEPAFLRSGAGTALDGRLDGAALVSAYVVSLGAAWDDAMARLCDRDEAAAGWFLDQVANAWIDEAARELERMVEGAQARRGLGRAPRVRAGYRGHPALTWHAELCAAAGAERIGVSVLESGALLPAKTVTGIVGWAPVD